MSEANIKILKQCLNCGNMFEAHKTTTKYCTHKCNSQHYKLRKRLEQKSEIEQAPILNTKFKSVTKQLPSWLNDYNTNDKKIDCLFGEHLVNKYKNNPIAIVEAPKTALICTLYYGFHDNPFNTIWLSATMLNGLSEDKFKAIQYRNITLYPDLSKDKIAFNEWKKKADIIQDAYPNIQINVSDYLEKVATNEQRNKGFDLADFLINHNWQLFRNIN